MSVSYTVEGGMSNNDKLESIWKGAVVVSSMYYHGISKSGKILKKDFKL
jgi:hypothetical protein